MLRAIHSFAEILQEKDKLLALYREGQEVNSAYFWPNDPPELALAKAETRFLDDCRDFFRNPDNTFWVLEGEGQWLSGLRTYRLEPGFYYMQSLETHPDFRRQGFGVALLSGVLEELKKQGSFRLCSCVRKSNVASLRTHRRCGFVVASDPGVDYLDESQSPVDYGMEFTWEEK